MLSSADMTLTTERRLVPTLEAWAELDEEERGEWVDGVLVEDEMPSAIHELIVAALIGALRDWARRSKAFVFGSGIKWRVTARRGRVPDVVVYFADAPRPERRGLVTTPPSLVVEVVTDNPRDERRDRIEKLGEYAAGGARFYWLVDPALRSLEILELGADGRYVHAAAITEGVMDAVPGCPGLRIDVDALWAELDAFLSEAPPSGTETE